MNPRDVLTPFLWEALALAVGVAVALGDAWLSRWHARRMERRCRAAARRAGFGPAFEACLAEERAKAAARSRALDAADVENAFLDAEEIHYGYPYAR